MDVAVMVQQRDKPAEADIAEPFAWVNAWASEQAVAAAAPPTSAAILPIRPDLTGAARRAPAAPPALDPADQLARDLGEIARARDELLAATPRAPPAAGARIVWLPFALRRTADSVPILLGSVLGMLMLIVFSVAAVFAKLAR